MDSRQERKDLALRRRMRRALGATAVLGIALLAGYEFWLRRVEATGAQDPQAALRSLGFASMFLQAALVIVAAVVARILFDWARQVRDQGQWPPAGLELPGNRPLRHGVDADRIARRLSWAGAAALALAVVLASAMVWRWLG